LSQVGEALLMAIGMFWDVGWSRVLGFAISAVIQAVVSTEQMRRALGSDGVREIALATVAGAVSSSCSYASAAISRTLFKKGAALIPSLAFLFASTNLVIELGIILYLLMGWQFAAAEWIGGVLLVVIMSMLVRLTYPAKLVEEARRHPETSGGHEHEAMTLTGETFWQKLKDPSAHIVVAQNFAMDWSMLWKDLVGGFLIAGALSAFIPAHFWAALFLKGTSPWLQVPLNALLDNVEQQGAITTIGATLVPAGQRLAARHIGLLSNAGLSEVPVVRRPCVRILVAKPTKSGAGNDCNGPMIRAAVERDGGVIRECVAVERSLAAIRAALVEAGADIVVVIGGTGVGIDDHSAAALAAAGELAIHGMALRPGETAGLGRTVSGVPWSCCQARRQPACGATSCSPDGQFGVSAGVVLSSPTDRAR
jgi:uncharacterized membrane protein YraQ (UPF0718 family)